MAKMILHNIDDFEDAPAPIIDGDYTWECTAYEQAFDKNGSLYFKLSGKFLEGPVATDSKGNAINYEGRDYTVLIFVPDEDAMSEVRLRITQAQFKAFMVSGNIPWDNEGYDPDDFVSSVFRMRIGKRKDSDFTEVKRWL